MKQMVVLLLCAMFLFTSCKKKLVEHPVPLIYEFLFPIELISGNTAFDATVILSGADILNSIQNNLPDDMTLDDLRGNNVEGLSYIILSTNQYHAVMDGIISLRYAELPEEQVVVLDDEILGNHKDYETEIPLSESSVEVIQTALDEIIESNGNGELGVRFRGDVLPDVAFMVLQVNLTVSHVIEQSIDVLDPL